MSKSFKLKIEQLFFGNLLALPKSSALEFYLGVPLRKQSKSWDILRAVIKNILVLFKCSSL